LLYLTQQSRHGRGKEAVASSLLIRFFLIVCVCPTTEEYTNFMFECTTLLLVLVPFITFPKFALLLAEMTLNLNFAEFG